MNVNIFSNYALHSWCAPTHILGIYPTVTRIIDCFLNSIIGCQSECKLKTVLRRECVIWCKMTISDACSDYSFAKHDESFHLEGTIEYENDSDQYGEA